MTASHRYGQPATTWILVYAGYWVFHLLTSTAIRNTTPPQFWAAPCMLTRHQQVSTQNVGTTGRPSYWASLLGGEGELQGNLSSWSSKQVNIGQSVLRNGSSQDQQSVIMGRCDAIVAHRDYPQRWSPPEVPRFVLPFVPGQLTTTLTPLFF